MTTQCSTSTKPKSTVENGDGHEINKQCRKHILVSQCEDSEPVSLILEDDNTLLFSTLCARFPTVTSLKYLNPQGQGYRVLRLIDGHFYPPVEKNSEWPDTVFCCVFPKESRHRESEKSLEEDVINQLSNASITEKPCARQSHNKAKSSFHHNGNSTPSIGANSLSRDSLKSGRHTPTDLIVLGLASSTSDDSLRNYFGRFGEVVMAQVKRNPHTHESRGFGFIRFADTAAQDSVLKDTHLIDERVCRVRVPNSKFEADKQEMDYKIHIRGITEQMTVSTLRQYFSQHGMVEDVFVPRPFRNFAFVTFRQMESAAKLIGRDLVIQGARVSIGSAAPKMSGYSGSGKRNSHVAAQPPAPLLPSSFQNPNISSHPPSNSLIAPSTNNSCSTTSSSPPLTANFSDPNAAMAALYAYLFAVSNMSPMTQMPPNCTNQFSDQNSYSQSQPSMQQRSLPSSAAASYDALAHNALYGWAVANQHAAAGFAYGLPIGSSYFSSPGTFAYTPVNTYYPMDHNITNSSIAGPTPLMESYAWIPEIYYSGSNINGGASENIASAANGTNNSYLESGNSQTNSQSTPCIVENILGVSGSLAYSPSTNGSNGSTNDPDLSVSNTINPIQTLHSLPGIPPVVNEAMTGAL